MKKIVAYAIYVILAFIMGVVLYVNVQLYDEPTTAVMEGISVDESLLKELRFLKEAMQQGAAGDMQVLYPEGYVFMNALYGLAWCDFATKVSASNTLYEEALRESYKAYQSIDSEKGREIFHEQLTLPYGAFYNGWRAYLLGKILSVQRAEKRDKTAIENFKRQCEGIRNAYSQSKTPHLESYYKSAWPADNVLCAAALVLHDRLFEPMYQDDVKKWTNDVKQLLDVHGLIPHSVDVVSGRAMEMARGSSQSLMLCFLKDIDPEFARQQIEIYKQLFVDTRLGLTGIREYPKGTSGWGDVDSGPVIFQMGGAATIVGMRTMSMYSEIETQHALQHVIEALAFPTENRDVKKYLFGQLPMVDAFVAWSHAARTLPEVQVSHETRTRFHIFSGVITVMCVSAVLFFRFRFMNRK